MATDFTALKRDRNGAMLCEAGYALIEQEKGVYRCEGGSHTYRFDNMTMFVDKAGNTWLKKQGSGGETPK